MSSNLNGFTIASIIFITLPPSQAPPATRIGPRRQVCRHSGFVGCVIVRLLQMIGLLTVPTDIQAFLLFILRHPEAYYNIDDLENNPGTDRRIGPYREHH